MIPMLMPAASGAMLLGTLLLFFSLGGLLALMRESDVLSLPVVAEQELDFASAGRYVLELEQPRLSAVQRGLRFRLQDVNRAQDVSSAAIVFRSTRSSFTRARIPERIFDLPRAGHYRLFISGLSPGTDALALRIFFRRPYAGALIVRILGIVVGGVGLIAGLVFMSLRFAGKL